jgi:uncharacterized protein (TIGR02246 family)
MRRVSSPAASLYRELLASWNRRDPQGFAALFSRDGHVVGFDGSEMNGREEIEASLREVFADHRTAAYVANVREERLVTPDVALLRAVAGMVPPGRADVNPDVNAIQSLVATSSGGPWRIVLFQNTPAQFHGRPELAEALTAELRALVPERGPG